MASCRFWNEPTAETARNPDTQGLDAIAIRVEAIASRLDAIAIRNEKRKGRKV